MSYFISTEGESYDRISALDLHRVSEDASHILDANALQYPRTRRVWEGREYCANPEREWIIKLQIKDIVTKTSLLRLFDYDWRSRFPSEIYGYSPEEERGHYVISGDSPERYNSVEVGINLQELFQGTDAGYDPSHLEAYIVELHRRIALMEEKTLAIQSAEPLEEAVLKAQKLIEGLLDFNLEAVLVLQSEGSFKGRDAWDALQCLGLQWGDGDLFHWESEDDYGDDQYFSVLTTKEPGYFLPEEIASGDMNPENLVFSFSVPRCADPVNVFAFMAEAGRYCQQRLGGELVNEHGHPFGEHAAASIGAAYA